MSKEVNSDLFVFLMNHETGLYSTDFDKNKTVFAYVHIEFSDLSDFIEIVGQDYFVEGGMDVQLFANTVVVEINDYIEGFGQYLSAYKKCFSEHTWKDYESQIIEMEAD
jgi:hypothetical protein